MGEREDVAVPRSKCPSCGYKMDSATAADGTTVRPKDGDFSLCLMCGVCLRFDRKLRLVPATESDLVLLDPETRAQIAKVTGAILELAKRRATQ